MLERAVWLAVTLLIVGGVVLGIDGMLPCGVLSSALSQVLTDAPQNGEAGHDSLLKRLPQ